MNTNSDNRTTENVLDDISSQPTQSLLQQIVTPQDTRDDSSEITDDTNVVNEGNELHQKYYHIFSRKELNSLFHLTCLEIEQSYHLKGSWIYILIKTA